MLGLNDDDGGGGGGVIVATVIEHFCVLTLQKKNAYKVGTLNLPILQMDHWRFQ